jgi:hypothetical protein
MTPQANDIPVKCYNPQATMDDGSCQFVEGCIDSSASNYNDKANLDDETCKIDGCTDETANNYNPAATDDDGSCDTPPPP